MSRTAGARKAWFLALARRYVRRKLRAQFDGFALEGLAATRAMVSREPVIIAATHASWWDALVAIQIDNLLGTDGYCLMNAENLARYPFFGWLGALPLDRNDGKNALSHMRAAASLLDRPGRALWIFPQGRQRASHLRPLALQPGVLWLSRATGAPVIPLALAYVYREAPAPTIIASLAEPIGAGTSGLMATLEERLVAALGRIDQFVEREEGAFVPALRPRAAQAMPMGGRLLSLLVRSLPARAGEQERRPS